MVSILRFLRANEGLHNRLHIFRGRLTAAPGYIELASCILTGLVHPAQMQRAERAQEEAG